MTSLSTLNKKQIKRAYARWEPVYDWIFGDLLAPGRQEAIELINQKQGRVLEVGVGTGISLPYFKQDLQVVGIDLSPEMLKKARKRVLSHNLHNVENILEMDAARMHFADSSFDIAVAMYVLTAVPDPLAVIREMERVCRPGGEILIVNHFKEETGMRSAIERGLRPMASALGWRPDFPRESLMGAKSLHLKEVIPLKPFGLFTLLRFVREPF